MEPMEPAEDADRGYEEFMRRPSTAPDCGVDLRGFATKEQAEQVGSCVNAFVQMCGRIFDLKRLKQVIVAWDYDATLAALERGAPVSGPLKATCDGLGVGIAMTPTILDEGEPKSVIVFNALHMSVFAEPDRADLEGVRKEMGYTIIHECAHVHDLEMRVKSLRDVILKVQLGPRDRILFPVADACWSEYIACRLSAPFAPDSTLQGYAEVFAKSLEGAVGATDAAIRQYRMHRDIERLLGEAAEVYKRLLTYSAYLVGHVEGLSQSIGDAAPDAMRVIERNSWFKPFFEQLRNELEALYGAYGEWKSLEVFEPLKRLVYELLKDRGIDVQAKPDGGAYINVPFREGTVPSLSEQAAFRLAREGSGTG